MLTTNLYLALIFRINDTFTLEYSSLLFIMPHSTQDEASDCFEFADLPPFPSDVPTAPLLRIELVKLLSGDEEEIDRLWNACRDLGFFYLYLRQSDSESTDDKAAINGDQLLLDADELFKVGKQFYDLPVAEKVKYDFKAKGSYFGYKGYGDGVIDVKGTTDRNEFYNVRTLVLLLSLSSTLR